PTRLIAAIWLPPMEQMLDGPANVTDIAIDVAQRATFPALDLAAIGRRYAARHRGIAVADQRQRHVVVSGPHAAQFKQAANPVDRQTRHGPGITRMRMDMPTAAIGPRCRQHRLTVEVLPAK